ncbi:MAG: DUF2461 domain-containing protein [Acidiferrobacterales bacterium]
MANSYFSQAGFGFLKKLENNNNRDWFNEHKQDYEDLIRSPALDFITDMIDGLASISPHFVAIPKKMGGSLMRVHRDVRFGKDKRPYKTNIGIQFRHELGKDVHAPGFYLHIEPGNNFVGAGIWRPDSQTLATIRTAIVDKSNAWIKASQDKKFTRKFELAGDSLSTYPRGYDKQHPLIKDLKRKDFIAITSLDNKQVISNRLLSNVTRSFEAAIPLMKFLCKSLELRF